MSTWCFGDPWEECPWEARNSGASAWLLVNITGADFGSLGIFRRPPSTVYTSTNRVRETSNETRSQSRQHVHTYIQKLKAFRSSKHASLAEQTMEASMRQAGGLISISLICACMPINADRPCCVVSGYFVTRYIGRRIAETFNYTGHSALVNKNWIGCVTGRAWCRWRVSQKDEGKLRGFTLNSKYAILIYFR